VTIALVEPTKYFHSQKPVTTHTQKDHYYFLDQIKPGMPH